MLSQAAAVAQARRVLAGWLEDGRLAQKIKFHVGEGSGADLLAHVGDKLLFVVECKTSSGTAAVGNALVQAQTFARKIAKKHRRSTAVPVVAVPYMGEVGKTLCAGAGVSWFDLSGNAQIVAPGLGLLVEGKPNKFTRRGRPSTAFGPRSARVARLLLMNPSRSFQQQELARATGLDDGFVSRIIRRLEGEGLVAREKNGTVRPRDPNLMLDAWREAYDFTKHTIVKGHVTAGTSEDLMARISKRLHAGKLQHAATGLTAAWLLTGFAGFRLVTFFTERLPEDALLRELGFREEPKGANVWLVVPNDPGVFSGWARKNGIACVHPLQAYLDLHAQPERAKEAAEELRARYLRWEKE